FLQDLEDDLVRLAEADAARTVTRARHRRGTWLGAVAGVVVLAFGVGAVAGGGLLGAQRGSLGSASRAAVGDAVNGADQPQPQLRTNGVPGHELDAPGGTGATGSSGPGG